MSIWLVFQNHVTFVPQTHLTISCHCTGQFNLSHSSLYNNLFCSTSVLTVILTCLHQKLEDTTNEKQYKTEAIHW